MTTPGPARGRWAIAALVAANVAPLVGVLFLGWTIASVMLLAWAENVVVGLWNVVRLITVRAGLLVPFFMLHYGIFMVGHGAFVLFLFVFSPFSGGIADLAALRSMLLGLVLPVLLLVVSHGVSFFTHFLPRERHDTTPADVMMAPYPRIIALHLTIIFAGFTVVLLGAPAFALVLLVLLKIVIDVALHRREHREKRLSSPPGLAA